MMEQRTCQREAFLPGLGVLECGVPVETVLHCPFKTPGCPLRHTTEETHDPA